MSFAVSRSRSNIRIRRAAALALGMRVFVEFKHVVPVMYELAYAKEKVSGEICRPAHGRRTQDLQGRGRRAQGDQSEGPAFPVPAASRRGGLD